MTRLVLHRASTETGREVDIVLADGRIVDLVAAGKGTGDDRIDLEGRPVLPGLVDHHVHLFALAASLQSVDLSPGALDTAGGLDAALRAARIRNPDGWLRGVGYDLTASGWLDRHRLDAVGIGPVRIQDRTGIHWILDGRALDEVLPGAADRWPDGVEVVDGRPTGVLRRLDHWLGHRLPSTPIDLAAVGRSLVAVGITAVTDAGADNDADTLAALAAADLPVRITAMTRDVDVEPVEGLALGPVKVLLDDTDLPALDVLTERIAAAHAGGRNVAVHCVSQVQLALALAAGIDPQDRVEHASFVDAGALRSLHAAGPTVVVQPALVRTRGDRYLAETEPADHADLHRLGSLRGAGLRIAASSDAPYGPPDPWLAIRAAVDRRTANGAPFGPAEALMPADALALWTGAPDDPSTPRTLRPGSAADLVVLDDDWDALARNPRIQATLIAGELVHGTRPDV